MRRTVIGWLGGFALLALTGAVGWIYTHPPLKSPGGDGVEAGAKTGPPAPSAQRDWTPECPFPLPADTPEGARPAETLRFTEQVIARAWVARS